MRGILVLAAAAIWLAACSPEGASPSQDTGGSQSAASAPQEAAPLTIKGLTLGMTVDQMNAVAQANAWDPFSFTRSAVHRSAAGIKAGDAYFGQVVVDDATGLFYFELNTTAFGARDLSFQAFVEQLQANYQIGELAPTHNFGDCGRWEGKGPAGETVAVSNCGAWSVQVTASVEQTGANFN